ncbi:glycoside hydrolase family 76 protein [Parathielavia appendiculata]|uniref:Glycoside hydrolase family 76 protein n=1 Tax=Parathielavia appendiculata TaxID=2587402 RepID=A0AAN6UAX0_9PEZI|nr:glycoside hydrolase family 76 protein [Parathielavia appendiculata]
MVSELLLSRPHPQDTPQAIRYTYTDTLSLATQVNMLVSWAVVVAAATAAGAASPWPPPPLKLKNANSAGAGRSLPDFNVFQDMFMALSDMQDAYFERWVGTWPKGIDWTRAVMSTHVAATLRTISHELERRQPNEGAGCATRKHEVIAGYFADVIAYYFAEDAFAIRNQAYDDMLWVVLGWLESIQFVDEHNRVLSRMAARGLGDRPRAETWYGSRWIPAFAHRARIFWELAAKGWDTTLCGGGMLWNPRLMPYKNAITNELFMAASISMYLHFPGDPNTSPFSSDFAANQSHWNADWRPHDPVFGKAAQEAHRWLTTSNMTNAQGLYADGFHISGHGSGSNNTRCDERDEMVYTYNQGVILSGLLGLSQATGREHYLREGHALIKNVIRATGYDLARNVPVDDLRPGNERLPPWRGLGRAGILEDACDVSGTCSQDAQTFKGIWMHHFATFCSPTALQQIHPHTKLDDTAKAAIRARHASACRRYIPWLRRNARAAMGTRDARGLFGMWWTAGLLQFANSEELEFGENALPPSSEGDDVVDYRNLGVPQTAVWVRMVDLPPSLVSPPGDETGSRQKPMGDGRLVSAKGNRNRSATDHDHYHDRVGKRGLGLEEDEAGGISTWDPNLRGRGRTVETQGGGLAVLRALWVVSRHEL